MRKPRSRQRRDAPAAPVPVAKIAPPSPPSSQRGTFRVAKALRQAAADLPGIIRNRQAESRVASAKRRLVLDMEMPPQAAAPLSNPKPKAKPRPTSVKPDQPTLESAKSCKSRPAAKAAKSGDGSSRDFVPWC